jgi:hypothetical protein
MDTSGEFEFDSEIAADRILAAIAKEREGEVTVGRVVCKNWPDNNDPVIEMRKGLPKQNGDIIFRPAKGDR